MRGDEVIMMNNFVWNELKFFLTRLKSLRVSESMNLNDESFCVSTGTYSENWIYCPNPERANVNDAVNFFRERDISFMWPVCDSESLRHTDLIYAGDLTAMSLELNRVPESNPDITIMKINSREHSALWAKTAWHSFGGEYDDVPENYYAFIDALTEDENLSLYLALHDDKPSGTFLTTIMGGVYYFGVIPEMRRKGVAREMMNEICRHNTRVVLQSTPSGYAFYKSYGFAELFRMPVYSTEADVF